MNIAKDAVVQFHYTLKDEAGQELESSRGASPIAYLHGYGNLIKGLEAAMPGKAVGESFSVTVPPEDGYGERIEGRTQRVSIKHLQGAKTWKPGMVAAVHTDQGVRQVVILKVGRFNADVDLNHPLAGKTLTFDVEIVGIREATAEELAHGHAHGDGGHHH